jgi:two-component system cell cycle sensor histidine kinase/response regulator CckA
VKNTHLQRYPHPSAQKVLSRYGYTVLTASDGERALQVFQSEKKIDLIILDVIMPGMGGWMCLEELLKIRPEAKVVIASGYSADGDAKDWTAAGARAFINKPYDIDQILRTVRKALGERVKWIG